MRNFIQLFCYLLSFILCSHFCSAQTYNFQWSTFGWTTATYSGTANNIGGSGINLTVGIVNSGSGGNTSAATTSVDNNAFQYNTPRVGAAANAWILPGTTGGNVLAEIVDWSTLTNNVTTTLTFSQPVSGITFYVGDIDRNTTTLTYVDQITVTGKNGATAVANPSCTKYVTTAVPANDTVLVSGNVAYGNANLAGGNALTTSLSTNGATVQYNFPNAVTVVTIVYNEGPGSTGNPVAQAIVIGDISFTKTIAPVTTNMQNTTLFNTAGLTAITPITGTDADGTVVGYTLETLPTAAMGTLTINGAAAAAGTVYTAADVATLKFTPNTSYTGDASFTFSVTDNVGLKSNISTYTIPVDPLPAPITNNIVAPVENNSYGQTVIPSLSGAVAAGSIASYTINTIPSAAAGVLYLCTPSCVAVTANQVITEANKANLKFDPAATFTGTASFTYTATSAAGVSGNTATYSIPVNNQPPIANTIISTILTNTDVQDPIPALAGSDADGTVASFNIATLPSASEGVLYLCTPTCTAVTAGQSISLANAGSLKFTPNTSFTGTSRFTYTATDNSGNVSPAAAYNVPIKGTVLNNIAPYADNIVSQELTNADPATPIPALAGHDPEGTIANYKIVTIPSAAQGVLYLCTPSCAPVTAGQTIPAANAGSLQFDPAPGFAGTAGFTYSATDNSSLISNIANYSLPIVNVPPIANPVVAPAMPNTYGQTAIPALSGHDPSTITTYTISNVPLGTSGTLYLCNPTCTAISTVGSTTINVADIGKLKFAPNGLFSGNFTFNYTATDNTGAVSSSAAYTIPVINTSLDANMPPLADSKTSAAMPNTNAQTAISALSGSDPDGTVASFVVNTLPPASQGVLYLCNPTCAVITAGQTILAADAAKLTFDPTAGFVGNAVFDYTSVDNAGKTSAIATITIPVTGTAPVAANVVANKMALTDPSTPIPSLAGTDQDGSVASYTITSIPPAAAGVLYLCTPTCTAVTLGQSISTANAGNLQFDPGAGYTGLFSSFNYTATDNTGRLSNNATFILPLTNNALLPVDLVSFTAEKKPGAVLLTWVAEHEINLQSYAVERSTDGINFTSIGNVTAVGSTIQVTYHFNDDKLVTGAVLYYRLKTVDKDGKFKYSVILSVRQDNNVKRAMIVSPNPATDKVNIKISADIPGNTELRIVNSYGETVYRQAISLVKGDNYYFIYNLTRHASGVYTVQTVVQGQIMIQKIIITR